MKKTGASLIAGFLSIVVMIILLHLNFILLLVFYLGFAFFTGAFIKESERQIRLKMGMISVIVCFLILILTVNQSNVSVQANGTFIETDRSIISPGEVMFPYSNEFNVSDGNIYLPADTYYVYCEEKFSNGLPFTEQIIMDVVVWLNFKFTSIDVNISQGSSIFYEDGKFLTQASTSTVQIDENVTLGEGGTVWKAAMTVNFNWMNNDKYKNDTAYFFVIFTIHPTSSIIEYSLNGKIDMKISLENNPNYRVLYGYGAKHFNGTISPGVGYLTLTSGIIILCYIIILIFSIITKKSSILNLEFVFLLIGILVLIMFAMGIPSNPDLIGVEMRRTVDNWTFLIPSVRPTLYIVIGIVEWVLIVGIVLFFMTKITAVVYQLVLKEQIIEEFMKRSGLKPE